MKKKINQWIKRNLKKLSLVITIQKILFQDKNLIQDSQYKAMIALKKICSLDDTTKINKL